MRHVIARDASPYFALLLENYRFSFKARYVNDVHLAPLQPIAPPQILQQKVRPCVATFARLHDPVLYGTATRSQKHRGDSKDFSPSNSEYYTINSASAAKLTRDKSNSAADCKSDAELSLMIVAQPLTHLYALLPKHFRRKINPKAILRIRHQ